MSTLIKLNFLILLSLIVGSVTSVYAYSNNDKLDRRGEGASDISGWSVSNVNYITDEDPTTISGVEFDLDSAAGNVMIKLVSTNSSYFSCTNISGNRWYCKTSHVSVASADELRVVATSK